MSTSAITPLDAKEKGSAPSHLARAVALHLAGKREEALKQLQGAATSGKASAEVYRAMGHIHFEMEDFQQAGSLEPAHLDAHVGLGISHLRLEDPKSALFSFERSLELSPEHEDALFGKAVALQTLGH